MHRWSSYVSVTTAAGSIHRCRRADTLDSSRCANAPKRSVEVSSSPAVRAAEPSFASSYRWARGRAVTSPRIRVFLLDDHTVLRQAVRVMLEAEGIEVVGEAGDVESGVPEILRTNPDVALVDLKMPGVSGLEAIRRIVADAPRTGI